MLVPRAGGCHRRSLLASVGGASVCAAHVEILGRRAAVDDRRAGSVEHSLHAIARRGVCVGRSRDSIGRRGVFSARRDRIVGRDDSRDVRVVHVQAPRVLGIRSRLNFRATGA